MKLIEVMHTESEGDALIVSGADILNGTPIYDIKPYLKYTDSHEDAVGGFADGVLCYKLEVSFPDELLRLIKDEKRASLISVLENDPRPQYIDDAEREYGMSFSDFEIKFKVDRDALTVTQVIKN